MKLVTLGSLARTLGFVASMALAPFLAAACADPCNNTVLDRQTAPDGRLSLVLFARDCGATTGVGTHASVLRAGTEPRRTGNVFAADLAPGGTAAPWGGPWVAVQWLAATTMPGQVDGGAAIIYDEASSRVFKRLDSSSGVQVLYETRSYQP